MKTPQCRFNVIIGWTVKTKVKTLQSTIPLFHHSTSPVHALFPVTSSSGKLKAAQASNFWVENTSTFIGRLTRIDSGLLGWAPPYKVNMFSEICPLAWSPASLLDTSSLIMANSNLRLQPKLHQTHKWPIKSFNQNIWICYSWSGAAAYHKIWINCYRKLGHAIYKKPSS